MEEQTNKIITKKNIISFLVIGILLLSIPFGVRLALEQTQLRSRAAGTEITFVTGDTVACTTTNGKESCTTTSDTVPVELRSPFGPPGAALATPTPTGTPRDAQQGWVRDCKLTPPNITSDCLGWELKSFGSASSYGPFNSVTGVFYMNNNKPTVRSLLLNIDGKTLNSTTREVAVPAKDASDYRLLFTGTPAYAGGRFGIPGEGDAVFFNDLNEFNYEDSNGNKYVHQTAVIKGGLTAYIRDCKLTPPNITSDCLPWEYKDSFGSAAGYGPFKSISGVFYMDNGIPTVRSLLLNIDGKTLKVATRPVTPSYPLQFGASVYTDGRFGIPGEGSTVFFNSLDEFKYIGADGKEYVHQSAVEVPPIVPPSLGASIGLSSGGQETTIAKGQTINFKVVSGGLNSGQHKLNAYVTKIASPNVIPENCPADKIVGNNKEWCMISLGSNQSYSNVSWTAPTNATGVYYIEVNADLVDPSAAATVYHCSGNPWCQWEGKGSCGIGSNCDTQCKVRNNWSDCSDNDYIKVTVN